MTDYTIPCDTFARLCNVLHDFLPDAGPTFKAVRIDNGQAVASNRAIMVIENIGGVAGVVHIPADPILIEACRKEVAFKSSLTISVNEVLRWASAKTTLGYQFPGNAIVWPDADNPFDKWREVVMRAAQPAQASHGGMLWNADNVARLAAASPSGRVVFEEFIIADGSRPTLIRDVYDPNWLGVIQPFASQENYQAASMPAWMTAR